QPAYLFRVTLGRQPEDVRVLLGRGWGVLGHGLIPQFDFVVPPLGRLANAMPIFARHVWKSHHKTTTLVGLMASFGAHRAEDDGLDDLSNDGSVWFDPGQGESALSHG
ncbi:MAG: hypothetical protein ABW003_15085, partial [Microvirga sp.]